MVFTQKCKKIKIINFSEKNNVNHTSYFLMKCLLHYRSGRFILFLFLSILIIFGFALRIAERPFMYHSMLNWDYVWNGFWCVIVLVSTGIYIRNI